MQVGKDMLATAGPGRRAIAFAHAEFSEGGRGAYSSDEPNQAKANYQSVMGVVVE